MSSPTKERMPAAASAPPPPLLEVENLTVYFPLKDRPFTYSKKGAKREATRSKMVRAVDGVSFTVNRGETLGIVGESGCGKSTMASAIVLRHRPTAGRILFEGEDLTQISYSELLKRRKNIQMIFQNSHAVLNPRMSAHTIIAEPLHIYRARKLLHITRQEIAARTKELMDIVELPYRHRNRYPHEFSGGQRQRIGIARALALNPSLILADEPLSSLDVSIQSQILNLLRTLQAEFNITYILISHDLSAIRYMSHHIGVMYLGKIVELAPNRELYTNPLHPYTKALISAIPVPDPHKERHRTHIILSGDPPSPIGERRSCPFSTRCPSRMEICSTAPQLRAITPTHHAACHLHFDPTHE